MSRKHGRITNTQVFNTFNLEFIINNLTHSASTDQMILRRDMVPHVLDPFFFGLDARTLGRQDTIAEGLFEDGLIGNFVHPFDAFGEDLGVGAVLEVAWIDARVLCWV